MIPEIELLVWRFRQATNWLTGGKIGRLVRLIGTFVLVYIAIGVFLLILLMTSGVNPTLIISVVAAPMWIGVIWLAWQCARIILGKAEQ